MWLQAPNINCQHGFSTRHGGVSQAPFHSLNLGGTADVPESVAQNRRLALQHFNLHAEHLCSLRQVHGNQVRDAKPGEEEGDALVSSRRGDILVVSVADCYPILFYDETNGVIGAAHAGWRGTVTKIAGQTVAKMREHGAKPDTIKVAIGQGISQDKFEVGDEVIRAFDTAGFPESCWNDNKINLVECNRFVLRENNIPSDNIWTLNRCTFESDFFSYRRDKGLTGRMWGLICMS